MSVFLRKTTKPYKHLIKKELEKNPTADDVLEHLFGDRDGWVNSRYTIREYTESKANIIQRINLLWVWPCYMILIAPFKWILTGSTGVKSESKSMKVLKFLLGEVYFTKQG
jgi:hypothetical protein